ncbi:PAS domain S-box-containing protein [Polaromonas sp. CG_9.7]|uniref:CHASE domain-containing protein n=2 Tax=Polaromonas TaxID=52972 RepID=UPI001A340241|nr:CHASE domain-containing protein [Polaromonas sp. CG_9.7]MBG6073384.1 PAS domain S-box-containing protein [Polaromonas sp. CG_9.7]MBG6115431.1 PAS domain S-box-containing protein [Polaromonas sp. CG_9.2]MDH6186104.1 PAS domain S-box-containing protein [Polaromonas sp. CG_23.6]
MNVFHSYLSTDENSSDANTRMTRLTTALVLVVGLGITAAVLAWQHQDLQTRARNLFKQQVERTEVDVKHHLNLPFTGLKGAAGVYAASVSVERAEFRAFVESSNVSLEYPGIRGFGFIERVNSSAVDAFVAAQRRDGSPAFTVKNRGTASELYVIKFMEPAVPNQAALGLNLADDPVRMQAIERAITTGEATLSGRMQLAQDERQRPAFVFHLPIYRAGLQLATVEQRRAELLGILVAPVVVDEIMAEVAAGMGGQTRLAIYDSMDDLGATPDKLLFELGGIPRLAKDARPMFETSRVVLVGGRPLTLRMGTTTAFEARQGRLAPWLVGMSGSLLSGLLALIIWLLGSGRARALALAQRMTADLALERQRLHNIVEGTNVGTWVWHVQTGKLQIDERWAAMMGYDLAQLGPQYIRDWIKRVHPDEVKALIAALKRHFRGESQYFECEHRIRHRDGRWIWVLARGKVSTRTLAGKPEQMSGMHMDISDRQAAQLALRTSEENFRQLFESSLHGILQAMPNGSIQYANPAACKLFRLTQDEIRQRGRAGLVDRHDSRFHILVAQAMLSGYARGEVNMHRGDGSQFECELSLSNYLSPGGQPCSNLFLRDVTKRKRAEAEINNLNTKLEDKVRQRTAELEAANKELEAFSYSVAHDLRAPLRSIDGFSHLLEKSIALGTAERAKHYLHRIRAGVRQMDELTDGLLSLAHVSRTSLKSETVNLGAMAAAVLQACSERDNGRVVKVNVQSGLMAVGDRALLRQVMENLIGNAWKFTVNTAGAEIWMGYLPEDGAGMKTFYVRDNGAGFDMAYAEKLFGTFQRLHSPGEFSGTGIGLATTHRIVTRHGGRIWAQGAVGEGAAFFFSLPVAVVAVATMVKGVS